MNKNEKIKIENKLNVNIKHKGHQKKGERFKVEKQIDLGLILFTLHFYVREELIPEPLTTGQPVNPLDGYWILERVSYAFRC